MVSALPGIRGKGAKSPHLTVVYESSYQPSLWHMAQSSPGALVGSLGKPLGDVHTVILLHRWGFLWFTSLNLPPFLLQRHIPGISFTCWVAFSTVIFSRWLELSYLLEIPRGLKENSGSVGLPDCCSVSSSSVIVSSSQPPILRLL